MKKIIAHRGLREGPNPELENHPDELTLCRQLGLDVEIDVRFIDGKWWLGHDNPTYHVSYEFLQDIDQNGYLDENHAWIHAKNIECLYELRRRNWGGHYFWHQNDDVVLTSTGYLWTYPGKQLTKYSICVMPEWIDGQLDSLHRVNIYGVCTDFVNKVLINTK